MTLNENTNNQPPILIYRTDDKISVDVVLQDETLWLSQQQMASVFGRARNTITEHVGNIFADG